MRIVGRDDPSLWAALRAASGKEERQRVLGELARIHEPLVKSLVDQISGHAASSCGRMLAFGSWDLPRDDRIAAGWLAFVKTAEIYDPSRGRLSTILRHKIRNELQSAVEKDSIVNSHTRQTVFSNGEKIRKRVRLQLDVTHIEDEDHLHALLPSELPSDSDAGGDQEIVIHRDSKPVKLIDTRSALDVFLEDHCRWSPSARVASTTLRGRCESVARDKAEPFVAAQLLEALRARGVRRTRVRTEWSDAAEGFAGVTLHVSPLSPATFDGVSSPIPMFGTWRRT